MAIALRIGDFGPGNGDFELPGPGYQCKSLPYLHPRTYWLSRDLVGVVADGIKLMGVVPIFRALYVPHSQVD